MGGHLKSTKTEASAKVLPIHPALKDALLEGKSQKEYKRPGDFRFPVTSPQREEAAGPCGCSQEDPTRVCKVGIIRAGWHTYECASGFCVLRGLHDGRTFLLDGEENLLGSENRNHLGRSAKIAQPMEATDI